MIHYNAWALKNKETGLFYTSVNKVPAIFISRNEARLFKEDNEKVIKIQVELKEVA